MGDHKFSIGDQVWSKMKGYCPWPSRIAAPWESSLRNTVADKSKTPKVYHLVYFFGSNNFAWMPEDAIKPYEEFKDKYKNGSKTTQFKQGLKQVEEYIANGGAATLNKSAPDAAINSPVYQYNRDGQDAASNNDGDLPSIDEEIAAIHNKKPAKKMKNSHDSQPDSASLTSPAPSNVQRDYSRTPFKLSRKATKAGAESTETSSPSKRVKTSDDESYSGSVELPSPPATNSVTTTKSSVSKSVARNVILRGPQYTDVPTTETPRLNMSYITAKSRTIRPSTLKFGFIGLGFLGQRLLRNLLNSGHQVTIYNRSPNKCKEFIEAGASPAQTPADVVAATDVVFLCVSDPAASKDVVFSSFGILRDMNANKALVEMTSIDPETSNDISEAIISSGGRYLEAPPIAHGRKGAEDGELTIVASGDKTLYEDCSSCFQAMAKKTFFLGHQAGYATKMSLVTSMLYGTFVSAIAECAGLIDRASMQRSDFREILKLSVMNCPLADLTMEKIITDDFSPNMPLHHLQKDMRLALSVSDEVSFACPIGAVANEVYKNSKRNAGGENDASATFLGSRY